MTSSNGPAKHREEPDTRTAMSGSNRSSIVDLGTRVGLGSLAVPLAAMAEPAARMEVVESVPGNRRPGCSKLGGLPDLPPQVPWPILNQTFGIFVAQISFTEAPFLSPPLGKSRPLLSLFLARDASTGEIADGHVVTLAAGAELQPRVYPGGGEARPLIERHLTLRPELTLPRWDERERSPLDSLDLHDSDREPYNALLDELEAAQGLRGPRHRLLGHPREADHDLLVEAALMEFWQQERTYDESELKAEARRWRLLVQIDPDPRFALPFARAGSVYFCVLAHGGTSAYGRAHAFASGGERVVPNGRPAKGP